MRAKEKAKRRKQKIQRDKKQARLELREILFRRFQPPLDEKWLEIYTIRLSKFLVEIKKQREILFRKFNKST